MHPVLRSRRLLAATTLVALVIGGAGVAVHVDHSSSVRQFAPAGVLRAGSPSHPVVVKLNATTGQIVSVRGPFKPAEVLRGGSPSHPVVVDLNAVNGSIVSVRG